MEDLRDWARETDIVNFFGQIQQTATAKFTRAEGFRVKFLELIKEELKEKHGDSKDSKDVREFKNELNREITPEKIKEELQKGAEAEKGARKTVAKEFEEKEAVVESEFDQEVVSYNVELLKKDKRFKKMTWWSPLKKEGTEWGTGVTADLKTGKMVDHSTGITYGTERSVELDIKTVKKTARITGYNTHGFDFSKAAVKNLVESIHQFNESQEEKE